MATCVDVTLTLNMEVNDWQVTDETMLSDHHLIRFSAMMALPKIGAQYNYNETKWDPFFADSEIPTSYPE